MEPIKRIIFALAVMLCASVARADLTDIKFGQSQVADSQWNVSACLNTTTCQIYSKQPGTAYKIPWTSGQVQWAAGDYIKFELGGNSSFPYLAKQYDSAGNVKATIGTGKIVNMGPDYFFFVGNDNNTGQLFSGSSGMSGTAGVTWTGTLNPTVAQANTYADANYSTVPLAAGQTATVTPSSSGSSGGTTTTTCNPCSPNTNNTNMGFESGTTANWTVSNGTGTEKTSGWSPNGAGVQTSKGMTGYQPGGGKTWTVTPYGTYMMVIQAGGGSPNFDPAMSALGMTTTEITNIRNYLTSLGGNSTPTNASWAKRTVSLEAGKTYVIAWQYMSTDYTPFNDGSIMTLVHASDPTKVPVLNNGNSRYALLGFTNPGTGNYATDSYGSTGWQLATITVPVNGDYVLGFASFNLGDTALSPILFVDDLQGTTTLNGTSFGPIAPNAGSTAPVTGGGGSTPSYSSNITTQQQGRIDAWLNRGNTRSGVFIEQIGNYNTTTVTQQGNKNNYVDIDIIGNNNTTVVNQSASSNTGNGQYLENVITGNNNSVTLTQQGDPGKLMFNKVNGSNNTVNATQAGGGNHYLDLTLNGNGHSVTVNQQGTAQHRSTISATNAGGASNINVIQQGSTTQVYSIDQTCTTASGCAVSITQGQ
jgi:hypothetical protein